MTFKKIKWMNIGYQGAQKKAPAFCQETKKFLQFAAESFGLFCFR